MEIIKSGIRLENSLSCSILHIALHLRCLHRRTSSGLLGDEAVDNLAGLAFGGVLGGGEAGAAGGP